MGVCGGVKLPQVDKLVMCLDAGNFKSFVMGNQWKDASNNGHDMWSYDDNVLQGSGSLSNSTVINSNDYVSTGWSRGIITQAGGWVGTDNLAGGAPFASGSNTLGITSSTGATIHIVRMNTGSAYANAGFKIFQSGDAGGPSRGYFAHITWSDGKVYFDTNGSTNGGSGGGRVGPTAVLHSAGDWQHWTFTKDTGSSGSNTQTIYLNGAQVLQRTNAGACPTLSADPMTIGVDEGYDGNGNERHGLFMLFNTCLTAAEVNKLYRGFAGNAYDIPCGRWVQA